jgi:hypothetical protein
MNPCDSAASVKSKKKGVGELNAKNKELIKVRKLFPSVRTKFQSKGIESKKPGALCNPAFSSY